MRLFSFNYDKSHQRVRLVAGNGGLFRFAKQLNELTTGRRDHFHLFTPDAGGSELIPIPYHSDMLLNQVNVYSIETSSSNLPSLIVEDDWLLSLSAGPEGLATLLKAIISLANAGTSELLCESIECDTTYSRGLLPTQLPVSSLQIIRPVPEPAGQLTVEIDLKGSQVLISGTILGYGNLCRILTLLADGVIGEFHLCSTEYGQDQDLADSCKNPSNAIANFVTLRVEESVDIPALGVFQIPVPRYLHRENSDMLEISGSRSGFTELRRSLLSVLNGQQQVVIEAGGLDQRSSELKSSFRKDNPVLEFRRIVVLSSTCAP